MMRKLIGALSAAVLLSVSTGAEDAQSPRISVFAKFVRNTAKERGISLAEAADRLYDIGVRGVDAGPGEKDLDALAATKLRIINFYFFPHMFDEAKCDEDIRFCLGQARKYAVPRVMVVPSSFTKDGDEEAEFEKDLAAMKKFVAAAKAQGIETTVEDFGGTANPCSHVKYLKRFLDEIPDLKFAADSGNLYYAGRGEDILEMLAYARGRVGHVHLKDQSREDNRRYVSLGLGAVPNERLVKEVNASGYCGWYTLENPVGDTLEDTVRQISVLKSWLSGK